MRFDLLRSGLSTMTNLPLRLRLVISGGAAIAAKSCSYGIVNVWNTGVVKVGHVSRAGDA